MSTNLITGTVTTGVTLGSASYATSVTVTATGQVSNGTAGGSGIYVPTGDTIVIQGSVTGGSGPNRTDPGGAGVALGTDATLTNSGTITGGEGSNVFGDTHGGPGGVGVSLASGDIAANSGLIQGGRGGSGHYGGYGAAGGGGVSLTGGTLTNTGTIIGGNAGVNGYTTPSSGGFGVYLSGGTLVNAGTIGGGTGSNATPTQPAGTNGDAVEFGTVAARLVIDPGAVFNGIVAANAAVNDVLELASSASAGTLSGLGSEYTGFTTVTIDSGATWDISGSASGFAGVTIAGFGVNDKLDILNVAYAAGETATLSASDVLTIFNAGGTSLASVQLSGDFANHAFSISGNGGHVQISEHVQRPFSEINGTYAGGVSLTSASYTSPVTITGTAHITGSQGAGSLAAAVYATSAWTIDTSGTVTGAANGIDLTGGGAVSNAAGGIVTGGTIGIRIAGGSGAVDNSGSIGTSTSQFGVRLLSGGAVTNEVGGYINGKFAGVRIEGATGTIDNLGTIHGKYIGAGIYIDGTLENSGLISCTSGTGIGVLIQNAGQLTNHAGGTIAGGYWGVFLEAAATIENAGTIIGSMQSVDFASGSGSDRLIIDPGAVFVGSVFAGGTSNTIELASGASIGTLSGLHTQYLHFGTVTIDSGAAWVVSGNYNSFIGETIKGFNSHDRLDLTDVAFDPGDTVSYYGASSTLVIKNSAGTGEVILRLDSSDASPSFHLLSDGNGGMFVEETGYAPCYLRGTRIRTPAGDRPVEELRIGDLIMIADGIALPLKWIGRRGYREWLAVGNEDVQPILFKAGSIADGVPCRDLYVSPEHAMFLDGMLVPAHLLVNGVSIVKIEGMEEIAYFHLEFDRHVVIFAEDAAAESFVDDDSRMLFHNAEEYRRLYPRESPRQNAEFCAPRVEAGQGLENLRRRLAGRSSRLRADGTAAPARRRGFVDRATRTTIEGWALPEGGPAVLAILVNGAIVGRAVADQYRPDLEDAGIGDGRCGFRFDLPRSLDGDMGHCIEVRHEDDWSLLHRGRVSLRPLTSRADSAARSPAALDGGGRP